MTMSVHRKPPDRRLMAGRGARRAAGGLLLGLCAVVALPALARDSGAEGDVALAARKQTLVRQLVEMTDAAQLEAIFSRQFIDRVANAVALIEPDIDARTMDVIREEATDVIHERIESGDALYSVLYPVYAKHFDLAELSQLMDFYQSPVGQKLIRVSPQLLTESLALGREWGLSLVPEIIDRVQARLADGHDTASHR